MKIPKDKKTEDITLSEISIYLQRRLKKKMNEEKEFIRNSKERFIKYIHLHTSKQQDKQTNDYCLIMSSTGMEKGEE